jgi:hypothetical protein
MEGETPGFTPPTPDSNSQPSAPQPSSPQPTSPLSSPVGASTSPASSPPPPAGSDLAGGGKSPFGPRKIAIIVVIVLAVAGVYGYLNNKKNEREIEELLEFLEDYDDYDDYDEDYYSDYDSNYGRETYYTEESSTPGYGHYVDTEYWFEMDYPESWEVEVDGGLLAVTFMSEYEDEFDYFAENVNVTTEDLAWYGPITLSEYADASLEQIKLALPGYEVMEIKDTWMGDSEAMYIYGSYVVGDFDTQIWSAFTIVNDQAYVMTYTCESAVCRDYDEYKNHMLESFTVI